MSSQVPVNAYAIAVGSAPNAGNAAHIDVRDPTSTDIRYPVGQSWINKVADTVWSLASFNSLAGSVTANWVQLDAGASSGILTINTISPDLSGDFTLTAGSNITLTPGSNSITIAAVDTTGITTITPDSGTVTPSGGAVTISGGSTGLTTSGSGSTLSLTGTLDVDNGGTGVASLTPYAVITGGTTSTGDVQQVASLGTSGQLLTSSGAGALPTWTTPTLGTTWNNVTSGSVTLVKNNGYVANGVAQITFNLPATAAIGDTYIIVGNGAGGWQVLTSGGQSINVGLNTGRTQVTSTVSANCITLTCVTANTVFSVYAVQGNIAI